MELISFLQSLPDFKEVPTASLQWMADSGYIYSFVEGDYIFQKDEPADKIQILLEGTVQIYTIQQNKQRNLMQLKKGDITGLLPYSRMTHAAGYGKALEPGKVFRLHRKMFNDLICNHHELTTAFVHIMSSRIREFTSFQNQSEKLMALGKLSAGLAHELNNPASAILRSASLLKENIGSQPTKFRELLTADLPVEVADKINNKLFSEALKGSVSLSLMEKTEREDELAEWLENKGIEDGYELAETFVDYGLTADFFEAAVGGVEEGLLVPALRWVESVLTTEKMVGEIQEASNRISDLVGSIKSYSHMDRGAEREWVVIHEGISSTLTMLQHKVKHKKVEVIQDFEENLPPVKAIVGELNQVWTNVLDNAIDAVEEEKGKITISTKSDTYQVVVTISDNGSGIPEELIGQIFDPFFTTKEVGKGTGLGLDIVKKIMDKHSGTINVSSNDNETSFALTFPLNE